MCKGLWNLIVIFAFSKCLVAQAINIIPDSYIIRLENDANVVSILSNFENDEITFRVIFPSLNLWNLRTSHFSKSKSITISKLQKCEGVRNVYHDRFTFSRRIPNDLHLAEQWPIERIGLNRIWDTTTGGVTHDGQEIVIAIIDDGFDVEHLDLVENIWHNDREINNNGSDDDQNGYVDDVLGLHIPSQSDNHIVKNHGTQVAGIIGAQGNNAMGISGINWDIRMMLLSTARSKHSAGGSVSDIIEAYNYVFSQRKKYNESSRMEGSFVVATNYSGGIDGIFPEDAPMWCEVYDELGKAGILNITSVTNDDVNVEEEGDMPTLCTSEYLFTVTNTDVSDRRVMQAGYGPISVDLGAPGDGTFSTLTENRYGSFDGTSASSPHAAGVAALLYALPCASEILELSKSNPSQAALKIKSAILNNVDPLPGFDTSTISGGRLNAVSAMRDLASSCSRSEAEFELFPAFYDNTNKRLTIEFENNSLEIHTITICNMLGQEIRTTAVTPILVGTNRISVEPIHLTTGIYVAYLAKAGGFIRISEKFMAAN